VYFGTQLAKSGVSINSTAIRLGFATHSSFKVAVLLCHITGKDYHS